MNGMTCDFCGKDLLLSEVRYKAEIKIFSVYDVLEISRSEINRDLRKEIEETLEKIEKMDEEELNDSVYREFCFDLCPKCQKEYIKQLKKYEGQKKY